jgi:hypothetical protein
LNHYLILFMVAVLAKSVGECVSPLAGELDPDIAPLVLAMRAAGFDTVSSCEGHFRPNDFKHARPNVVFVALDRGLLHSWIREVSRTECPQSVLPASFNMFPVWNPERDVVHEDNWTLTIDVSGCADPHEAEGRRNSTVAFLLATLEAARRNRPLATDTFVRSRW